VSKQEDYSSIRTSQGIVLPEVNKVLAERRKIPQTIHRTNIIFPSEMAKSTWCPRATYYRMSGRPDPESFSSFTLENIFAEGNSVHSKWQGWLSDTGKLWGDWRCSRCAEYVKDSVKPGDFFSGSCVGTGWVQLKSPVGITTGFTRNIVEEFPHDWKYKEVTLKSVSLPIAGHADGALTDHNVLIELKSVGIGSLRYEAPKLLLQHTHVINGKKVVDIDGLWKDINRPLSSHLRQGNVYLWMCKEMGLPFDRISFVYEFKASQQVKEFTVGYSEEIMSPMLVTATRIKNCLEQGMIPECPFGGCSSCKPYDKED
jgi:hypothetical protein